MHFHCVFLLGCSDDWWKCVKYVYIICAVLFVCHISCQLLSLCTYSRGGFIFILIFAQSYLDLLLTSGVFTWRYCNSFSACLQCRELPQCVLCSVMLMQLFPASWRVWWVIQSSFICRRKKRKLQLFLQSKMDILSSVASFTSKKGKLKFEWNHVSLSDTIAVTVYIHHEQKCWFEDFMDISDLDGGIMIWTSWQEMIVQFWGIFFFFACLLVWLDLMVMFMS